MPHAALILTLIFRPKTCIAQGLSSTGRAEGRAHSGGFPAWPGRLCIRARRIHSSWQDLGPWRAGRHVSEHGSHRRISSRREPRSPTRVPLRAREGPKKPPPDASGLLRCPREGLLGRGRQPPRGTNPRISRSFLPLDVISSKRATGLQDGHRSLSRPSSHAPLSCPVQYSGLKPIFSHTASPVRCPVQRRSRVTESA